MFNLVVYGSLLNPIERSRAGLGDLEVIEVVVDGFRRNFNQEPSWRIHPDGKRAVLGVEEHKGSLFNAIMISGLSSEFMELLDRRERGYTRTVIEESRLSLFAGRGSIDLECDTFIYCSRPERLNSSLPPNNSYLQTCIHGSRAFGQEFEDYFLRSTFVGNQTVKEFLSRT